MLTGAGIGRRWGGATGPPRSRGGSAELQCAAAAARVRGASVGWGSGACAGPIKGWSGSWVCVLGLARKSRR
jgi:hypothetical protein